MTDRALPSEAVRPLSWCVEWFGSQGDFIAGRAGEPISLERFAGLESLYAVGPLEQARGEVSIFDSVPLIAEVRGGRAGAGIAASSRPATPISTCTCGRSTTASRDTSKRSASTRE